MDLARLHPERGNTDMGGYIRRFAARFGINDIKTSKWLPNTRRALAISEFARDHGKLDEFRAKTMEAHWKEGLNIEDEATLRSLALAAGLDPDQAVLAATDPVFLRRIDQTRTEFKKLHTGGIPTLVFPGEIVEGCQPYENFRQAALTAGAVRRT